MLLLLFLEVFNLFATTCVDHAVLYSVLLLGSCFPHKVQL